MSNLPFEETHIRGAGRLSSQRPRRMRWIMHVSWTSVFAGVAVALGVQVLLSMLGTGIGMSTIDPLHVRGTPSATAFSIGAGLWWVVSSFLSLVVGGWVAAQFSGYLRHLDGLLHGLLVWAVTTLIAIYLLGSAISSVVSGTGTVLSAGAQGMAESASSVDSWDNIEQDALSLLYPGSQRAIDRTTGIPVRPVIMDPEFNTALERFLTTNDVTVKENNRTALINLLTARTGMSVDNATNRVNSWERTYEQAERKAREAADKAAKAVSWAALWGFLVILLSAVAGAVGGIVGTPIPEANAREQP